MSRKVVDRTFFEKVMILVDCLFSIAEVVIAALVLFKVLNIAYWLILNGVFFGVQALEYKKDKPKTAILYLCCAVVMLVFGIIGFFL